MGFIHSVILGVVEGLTEFLPVSSTAHLILASYLLKLPQSDYLKSFEIIIQLGAILAVVALYWKRFLEWEVLKKVFVAFLPTGAIGLLLYKVLKRYLLGNVSVVLWALALGGLLLILLEKFYFPKRAAAASGADTDVRDLTYRQCLALGLFQAAAMVPGVSRSAATIVGGMFMGIKRRAIVEFSFLLAVPTMAAATGLDLLKSAGSWNASQAHLLIVGFAVSFATALMAVRWFLKYVQRHSFTPFGAYRIALAVTFLGLWR